MIPVNLPSDHEADSWIQEIVPIVLKREAYPDIVLFKWQGQGVAPKPIQVLSFEGGQYVESTAAAFSGPAGNTIAVRDFAVADFNGRPGIFVADHGLDTMPFPGAQNTLLLQTPDGCLENATAQLPQLHAFSHDIAAGVIDDSGRSAVFVSNIGKLPPHLLARHDSGHFNILHNYLPASLNRYFGAHRLFVLSARYICAHLPQSLKQRLAPFRYTASALVDVTGSDRADLVIGTADTNQTASRVYINPGNGDFSRAAAIDLPSAPLSIVQKNALAIPKGAVVLDVAPIHLSSPDYSDLIVVSTSGDYTEHYVQLLINNGKGRFVDETEKRFHAPITGRGWIKRVHIADLTGDGTPDIVTQPCIGPNDPPSQVFLNNGSGHFVSEETVPKEEGVVYGIAKIEGQNTLILCDGKNISFKPTSSPSRQALKLDEASPYRRSPTPPPP